MACVFSQVFLKCTQRFEPLDLCDFVGFSRSREQHTILVGHLKLLRG
jgi:hypothetical protein